jgi:transposase-like protein
MSCIRCGSEAIRKDGQTRLGGQRERGLVVDRSTIYRWVQRFLPLFQDAARRHRHLVGEQWRVDETYTRLAGKWTYIYRAIDQYGQVVDAYFSVRRNAKAAQAFFERAIDETDVTPVQVITDKAKWYPPALRTVLPHVKHRTSKYLNNGFTSSLGHRFWQHVNVEGLAGTQCTLHHR